MGKRKCKAARNLVSPEAAVRRFDAETRMWAACKRPAGGKKTKRTSEREREPRGGDPTGKKMPCATEISIISRVPMSLVEATCRRYLKASATAQLQPASHSRQDRPATPAESLDEAEGCNWRYISGITGWGPAVSRIGRFDIKPLTLSLAILLSLDINPPGPVR